MHTHTGICRSESIRAFILAICFPLVVTSALGADRLVPGQYNSIQSAINASASGDRILISAGTYRESIRFSGKSVMVEGVPGQRPGDTVIISPAGSAVVIADSTAYSGTIGLRNLTIDGESGQKSGAGVVVSYLGLDANLLIERCILRNLRSTQTDGGALYLGHPSCTIRQCAFSRNTSTVHGAAIYAYDGVQASVEHCSFDGHDYGTGTFYSRTNAKLTVRDCEIRGSNTLTAHWQNGIVTYSGNVGCGIGNLSNGGYVDGGGNDWGGPCPDCDSDGIIDIEEAVSGLGGCADCNGDFRGDFMQIRTGELSDDNRDSIPDACQSPVTGVIPVSGPSAGGTSVIINGTNFPANPTVLVGGVPATDVVRVSATRITANTPAGLPGMTSVTVSNWVQPNAFYYRPECGSDLDQNGSVDPGDIAIILLDFGPCYSTVAPATQEDSKPFMLREEAAPVGPSAR
jgi:predicted outer membrane repeat protein